MSWNNINDYREITPLKRERKVTSKKKIPTDTIWGNEKWKELDRQEREWMEKRNV